MNILKYPDSTLLKISSPVSFPISQEDRNTLNEMFSYVKDNSDTAVGLAAVQIGVLKRMCAIRFTQNGKTTSYKLVNPKIISHSNKKIYNKEGCLSIDHEYAACMGRWESIKVCAFDLITNKNVVINASGYEAIVLQHEIDHMDGKLAVIDKQ